MRSSLASHEAPASTGLDLHELYLLAVVAHFFACFISIKGFHQKTFEPETKCSNGLKITISPG